MTTAPWSARAVDALRHDLFHEHAAEVVPAVGDPIPLDAERCEVTLDEGWAPHVQATLTCRVPEDQAVLDAIDPRAGAQVRIRAGYRYPGGAEDVHDLALLELRARPVRRPANTMTLDVASAECRLQDADALGTPHAYAANADVTTVVPSILSWALGASVDVDLPEGTTLGDPLTVSTGTDVWGTVADLVDRAGGWLYADATGAWHLTRRPTTLGRSAYIMDVGPGGNLTETEAVLDVAEWGNAVVLDYGDGATGYATATSGPFAVGTAPLKAVRLRRDTITPGNAAARNAAAGAVLRRVLSRGRSFTLTGPAAYWLRPGHTITARLPTGPQERHLVSRVTFDTARGEMTVRTRVPDDDTTITTGA